MNKKKITIATSSLLVVGIATSATLAYLNSTTQTNTNVFSSNKSVQINLREKAWDGFDFNEDYPKDVTPGTVVDSTESDTTKAGLGFTLAQNYYPGDVIPKDPTIKNVQEDAWVAIKVEYSEDTKGIIESITFDTAKWGVKPIATSGNSELYMYNSVLAKNAVTSALFSEVKIKSTVTDTKDFNIKVSGYAVQAHGVDEATATQELKTLAGF